MTVLVVKLWTLIGLVTFGGIVALLKGARR